MWISYFQIFLWVKSMRKVVRRWSKDLGRRRRIRIRGKLLRRRIEWIPMNSKSWRTPRRRELLPGPRKVAQIWTFTNKRKQMLPNMKIRLTSVNPDIKMSSPRRGQKEREKAPIAGSRQLIVIRSKSRSKWPGSSSTVVQIGHDKRSMMCRPRVSGRRVGSRGQTHEVISRNTPLMRELWNRLLHTPTTIKTS